MHKKASDTQRMTQGRLYNCTNLKILAHHARALYICDRYNKAGIWNLPKQSYIIRRLVKKHGKNFHIMKPFFCDYGFNISFGDNLFVNYDCVFLDCAPITIGNDVMFGPKVTLATPMHPLLAEERKMQKFPDGFHNIEYANPISIGDGAWIGSNVTVCGGVSIGAGAIIGAGSVVTRDIPSNCLAAGVPAKIIRELDEKDKMDVWQTYCDDVPPLSVRDRERLQNQDI